MTNRDIRKIERFYESVTAKVSKNWDMDIIVDFEGECQSVLEHYDGITELFGDAWPESFTESQKLSSVFVNKILKDMETRDCQKQELIKIDPDTLKVCSYCSADADVIGDAMAASNSLEKFHGLITVNHEAIPAARQAVADNIAEDPMFGRFLTQQNVSDVSEEIFSRLNGLDAGLALEIRDFTYERVAVVSTSYGNLDSEIKRSAQEMFQELNLPVVSQRQYQYELDEVKYWISEDDIYTELQMKNRYNTQINNMETEIPFWV